MLESSSNLHFSAQIFIILPKITQNSPKNPEKGRKRPIFDTFWPYTEYNLQKTVHEILHIFGQTPPTARIFIEKEIYFYNISTQTLTNDS